MIGFLLFCILNSLAVEKPFAVFKVSHNETDAVGGIMGTAFFVDSKEALTAYHVLNEASFDPAPGFQKVTVFLLNENHEPIQLTREQLEVKPSEDRTAISFKDSVVSSRWTFRPAPAQSSKPQTLTAKGYLARPAQIQFSRTEDGGIKVTKIHKLPYASHNLEIAKREKVTVTSNDVNLVNQPALRLSQGLAVGMSGGPLVVGDQVVGIHSFGWPANVADKKVTWALPIIDDKK